MNITVLGAGAMGSFFGGLLAEKAHSVTLLDINTAHIDAINTQGLCLEIDHTKRTIKNIHACAPQDAVGQPELLIVFTKSMHTHEALNTIQPIIGPHTKVLTLQNGLGNLEKIQAFVPLENILIGMTTWPADFIGAGHVASHGIGEIRMTTANQNIDDKHRRIVELFNDAGLQCYLDDNVWGAIWQKVAFNCALNSLCAVTGSTVDQLASMPSGEILALKIVDEVLDVASKSGIQVNRQATHERVLYAIQNHKGHMPSMLQDVINKRPTEINALNGTVVEKANQLSIAVPYTESLAVLVQLIDARLAREINRKNI